MKIVSWNVNSIRARLHSVIPFLETASPDVVLLQELKCQDQNFPHEAFDHLGYNIETYGQKSNNGVAILSKYPIEDCLRGIPNFEDEQARYIEAFTNGVRVASLYAVNGQDLGTDKYDYKLRFYKALTDHMKILIDQEEVCLIGGDYNIAPADKDVYDAKKWQNRILVSDPERQAFQKLLNLGYKDAFRLFHHDIGPFTWWDYRSGSFDKNFGLRIDHFLISPEAADRSVNTIVHTKPRGDEKASDHAPIEIEL